MIFFMRFGYDNPYIYDNLDDDFRITVHSDTEGKMLKDLLNNLDNKINYQEKVIDKCLKNERKYNCMIIDKNYTIETLKNEKRIMKKMLVEDSI